MFWKVPLLMFAQILKTSQNGFCNHSNYCRSYAKESLNVHMFDCCCGLNNLHTSTAKHLIFSILGNMSN